LDKRAAAADEASGGNAAEDNSVAAGWLGKGCGAHGVRALRLLHRATQGANKSARGRCGVVIWFTSGAISMCVGADQEHSSLMGAHCLGCSTLPTFHHGKRSHALITQCVRVRACQNPRRGREETGWHVFVPTNMSPLPPCVCYFVLLTRYWGIVTVAGSFLYQGTWGVCVLLCFINPILGDRYGPGVIPQIRGPGVAGSSLCVCVLLCFVDPILGNCYGPGFIP